jgi:hypothetical protein
MHNMSWDTLRICGLHIHTMQQQQQQQQHQLRQL